MGLTGFRGQNPKPKSEEPNMLDALLKPVIYLRPGGSIKILSCHLPRCAKSATLRNFSAHRGSLQRIQNADTPRPKRLAEEFRGEFAGSGSNIQRPLHPEPMRMKRVSRIWSAKQGGTHTKVVILILSLLTPHSSLLTPHSSLLTPHSAVYTPHSLLTVAFYLSPSFSHSHSLSPSLSLSLSLSLPLCLHPQDLGPSVLRKHFGRFMSAHPQAGSLWGFRTRTHVSCAKP